MGEEVERRRGSAECLAPTVGGLFKGSEPRARPRDPTIRERFNTYRFADYKEAVIALLRRVVTVSVETVKIVEKMG